MYFFVKVIEDFLLMILFFKLLICLVFKNNLLVIFCWDKFSVLWCVFSIVFGFGVFFCCCEVIFWFVFFFDIIKFYFFCIFGGIN